MIHAQLKYKYNNMENNYERDSFIPNNRTSNPTNNKMRINDIISKIQINDVIPIINYKNFSYSK